MSAFYIKQNYISSEGKSQVFQAQNIIERPQTHRVGLTHTNKDKKRAQSAFPGNLMRKKDKCTTYLDLKNINYSGDNSLSKNSKTSKGLSHELDIFNEDIKLDYEYSHSPTKRIYQKFPTVITLPISILEGKFETSKKSLKKQKWTAPQPI